MSYYDILEEIRILQERLSEMDDVPADHPDQLRHDELLCDIPLCSIPGGILLKYHKEMKERSAEQVAEREIDISDLESSILLNIANQKEGMYIGHGVATLIVHTAFQEYRKKLDQEASSVG